MVNNDLENELEQLRNQLEALKRERGAGSAVSGEQVVDTSGNDSTETADVLADATATLNTALGVDEGTSEDIITQFKELIDSIDKDIKNEKPTTLLLVFALGVLVGRL